MSTQIYNFGAGPAMLPREVLVQVSQDLLSWRGCGMSVMEMSHRGKEFTEIVTAAEADLRELMAIPSNYRALFLQGGATTQFAMVPMNLLSRNVVAQYVDTGHWSQKAIKEAQKYGAVTIAASSEETNFTSVPPIEQWRIDSGAAYLHYTPNETIGGVEFNWIPEIGEIPLAADMSSNILSRSIDVSRFGVIYAGAQKNIGPAGLTIVIIREDLVGQPLPNTPTMYDYSTHVQSGSMYNTPATFSIYVAGLTFQWLKKRGGLAQVELENIRKAKLLYEFLDCSSLYRCPVAIPDRSRMNVRFMLTKPTLDQAFLREAEGHGLLQLKGHRAIGGMRASIYNAMPIEGVEALIQFLQEFEATQQSNVSRSYA